MLFDTVFLIDVEAESRKEAKEKAWEILEKSGIRKELDDVVKKYNAYINIDGLYFARKKESEEVLK